VLVEVAGDATAEAALPEILNSKKWPSNGSAWPRTSLTTKSKKKVNALRPKKIGVASASRDLSGLRTEPFLLPSLNPLLKVSLDK